MYCILALILQISLAMGASNAPNIAERQEIKVEKSHKIDSLNLLMFLSLLILTVLTIWLFKHRRFRFVHETGLGIIYGLIVGAIIRYTSTGAQKTNEFVYLPLNTSFGPGNPPDSLKLVVPVQNTSLIYYGYSYKDQRNEKNVYEEELEEKATFNPEVFFDVLLPTIIFNAGYSMKRKHFFKNFGAIMTYALMGTIVSSFVVGTILFGFTRLWTSLGMSFNNCLLFGSIVSATDPVTILAIFHDLNVDVDLYALVFGESVLNDAVAIVLSATVEKYSNISTGGSFDGMAVLQSLGNFLGVFLGAFALGSAMGCVTAILTKYTHIRDYPLLETSLFFLMSYSTFLAAEAAHMTGIVAVLFCGICQAHYTYNNLSNESKARTKEVFELLNFLMENFVFTYIGVSTFTFQRHVWHAGFICASFLAVIVARACNIYPLSFLLNLGRSNKIRYNFQHMMMFSGLRGAIAFALAIRNTSTDQRRLMFSTTLLVVIGTVILCGGFTTQMLQWLKIRVGVEEDTELQNFEAVRTAMTKQKKYQSTESGTGAGSSTSAPSPSEPRPPDVNVGMTRPSEKAWLVLKWYNVDAKFVKPLLTHARPPLTETLPKCCLPLARLLTTDQQLTTVDPRRSEDSDTDLIIDENELTYGDQNSVNGHEINTHSTPNPSATNNTLQTHDGPDLVSLAEVAAERSTRVRIPGPTGQRL